MGLQKIHQNPDGQKKLVSCNALHVETLHAQTTVGGITVNVITTLSIIVKFFSFIIITIITRHSIFDFQRLSIVEVDVDGGSDLTMEDNVAEAVVEEIEVNQPNPAKKVVKQQKMAQPSQA